MRLINEVAWGYVTGHVTIPLQLPFLLGVSSVKRVRCVAFRSLVKNLLTQWNKGKENQLIDQYKKPLSPVGKLREKAERLFDKLSMRLLMKKPPNPVGTEEGKSKDEDDSFDRRPSIKNLLTQRGTEEENQRLVRLRTKPSCYSPKG